MGVIKKLNKVFKSSLACGSKKSLGILETYTLARLPLELGRHDFQLGSKPIENSEDNPKCESDTTLTIYKMGIE